MNSGHCAPLVQNFHQHSPSHAAFANTANTSSNDLEHSSFVETGTTQDELDARLQSEIRSLRRQQPRQLFGHGGESPQIADSETEQRMDGTVGQGLHHGRQQTGHCSLTDGGERPLFTYQQVRRICERLLKEQEMRLREEYSNTLNTKLAEQHEAFVRFTYDQIHRRLGDAPMSYLS